MPCPICNKPAATGSDHRWCLVELFKTNRIQSVADWQKMCEPKTIIKRTIKARISKEE